MTNKDFFVTIPMLPPEKLEELNYVKEGKPDGVKSRKVSFPSLAMIEWNAQKDDDIRIIAVMTDDVNGCSVKNLEKFKRELSELSDDIGIELSVEEIVHVPHTESKEKHNKLFKELCALFKNGHDIYMELTYGTKVTPIGLFSSLTYADKVCGCDIKSIIYGNYAFNDSKIGSIYDIRSMYDFSMFIHSAEFMTKENLDIVLNNIWG